MKKEEIFLADVKRILFGQAPPEFLIEVLVRTLIVYLLLLIILRLMGKRMDGQISIIEMAVMVMLGAIVSVGMQIPDRGILPTAIALILVFVFQRGINWLNVKNEKIENATNGTLSILVRDGVLQLDEMRAAGITRQNLFSTLRGRQIFNLGKVKRVYFEGCGIMNVYETQVDKSGLPVFPSNEEHFVKKKSDVDPEHIACKNCGSVAHVSERNKHCKNCDAQDWMEAVY